MDSANPAPAAKLAPPGAGLPKAELFFARLIFGGFRRLRSRAAVRSLFQEERGKILRLVSACGVEEGMRRILIKRLPGLEDSSRDWSVYMTLEHVRIVNEGVREAIRSLAGGKVPEGVASTASVKPPPGADAGAIRAFDEGCDRFLDLVAAVPDLRTPARYRHPWFGPLDAAGWHAIAAFHLRLHRKQIEAILARMKP